MKRFTMICIFSTISMNTHASQLDCERIKDHDARHMCRAETTGKRSWCSYIKERDMRARCFAVVH